MTAATLQVDTALSHIMSTLPAGTKSVTRRMEPTVFPIIAYGLTSDKFTVTELRDLVKFQIIPLLTTVPGLAKVDMVGGADAEVQVQVDPHKLDAYGLSLSDVVAGLTAANVLQAIGRLEDHNKLYIVISKSDLVETEQVRDVVLRSDTHSVVRIRDVADVKDGTVPQWVRVVEDGKNAVLFQVYEQPDGNAVRDRRPGARQAQCLQMAGRRQRRQLVRPEHPGGGIGQQRARRGADRAGPVGHRAVPVPAQLERHPGGRDRRSGHTVGHRAAAPGHRAELQHHDARRHRGGGRPHHRRRDRHGGAHRAPRRRAGAAL